MSVSQKVKRRQKLRWRIRARVKGTAERPRLSVFRSNRDIYAQLIDDSNGFTLVSASSRSPEFRSQKEKENKVAIAHKVGLALAVAAKEKGIEACIFDRGGYLFHGRVKSLAEGAREGGLKF